MQKDKIVALVAQLDGLSEGENLEQWVKWLRDARFNDLANLIERQHNDTVLLRSSAEGAGSLLLDVQQDCIALRAALREQAGEIERLTLESDNAISVLAMYGVPSQRAKSISNGIQVLVTRMDKERDSLRATLATQAALIADHEEVHADKRRLVRELDVILNGEDGAAPQASLCDIVGQAANVGRKLSAPLFEVLHDLADENVTQAAQIEELNRGMDARHDELMHIHGLHDAAIAERDHLAKHFADMKAYADARDIRIGEQVQKIADLTETKELYGSMVTAKIQTIATQEALIEQRTTERDMTARAYTKASRQLKRAKEIFLAVGVVECPHPDTPSTYECRWCREGEDKALTSDTIKHRDICAYNDFLKELS